MKSSKCVCLLLKRVKLETLQISAADQAQTCENETCKSPDSTAVNVGCLFHCPCGQHLLALYRLKSSRNPHRSRTSSCLVISSRQYDSIPASPCFYYALPRRFMDWFGAAPIFLVPASSFLSEETALKGHLLAQLLWLPVTVVVVRTAMFCLLVLLLLLL